jgi:hypothetical protein
MVFSILKQAASKYGNWQYMPLERDFQTEARETIQIRCDSTIQGLPFPSAPESQASLLSTSMQQLG